MVQKAKKREGMGDLRSIYSEPAVWTGRSKPAGTSGVHAVTEMDKFGARTAMCGLIGRYLVDKRVTAGETQFAHVPVNFRCTSCHSVWLHNASGQS